MTCLTLHRKQTNDETSVEDVAGNMCNGPTAHFCNGSGALRAALVHQKHRRLDQRPHGVRPTGFDGVSRHRGYRYVGPGMNARLLSNCKVYLCALASPRRRPGD